MSKLATKAPEQAIRNLSGSLRVLGKVNEFIYNVELELLDDRLTANGWRYINLEKHRASFAGQPILIAYTRGGRKIGDGHNFQMKRTADGREYASFTDATAERIIGSLSENEADIRLEDRDGHKWIVGKGTIWAWYAAETVEKIAQQGRMSISIETLVTENRMEGDVEIEEEYIVLGATILGDDVPPAVAGAHIRPLSQIDIGALKIRAASLSETETPEPKTPEKGVKNRMNGKKLRAFQALFTDDHVVGVAEDGLTVALCSKKDGDIRAYAFTEDEPELVLGSRFLTARATVEIAMANNTKISVPADELIKPLQEQISYESARADKAEKLLADAQTALKAMEDKERTRRKQAAKDAVRDALNEINRVQEVKGEEMVDEKVCEDVENAIENDEYTDCVNEAGEWDGDEKACAALKAKCMDIIQKNSMEAIAKKRNMTLSEMYNGLKGGGDATGIMADYNLLK